MMVCSQVVPGVEPNFPKWPESPKGEKLPWTRLLRKSGSKEAVPSPFVLLSFVPSPFVPSPLLYYRRSCAVSSREPPVPCNAD